MTHVLTSLTSRLPNTILSCIILLALVRTEYILVVAVIVVTENCHKILAQSEYGLVTCKVIVPKIVLVNVNVRWYF